MKILVDFHVHSDNSFDGAASLDALAEAAKNRGISALAITDHNVCTIEEPQMLGGVLFVPGCEVSTQSGHMTALFLDKPLNLEILLKNGLPTAEDTVTEIHLCGGIAVIAHPFYKPDINIDGIAPILDGAEVFNSRAHYKNPPANELAAAYADKFALLRLAGSDAHTCAEVGNSYTELDCGELTSDSIRQALLMGSTKAILNKNTPRRYKGVSQLYRARRTKSLRRTVIAAAYMGYCLLYDIFR